MSERINELAEQGWKAYDANPSDVSWIARLAELAWKEAYDVNPSDPRIARDHKAMEEGMEKFAKLIVKECAQLALDTDLEDVEGGDSAVLHAASTQIKKHFGVE
jgi:hypothetical protein